MSRQGVADPVRALADYRRGDFLFATQQRTLFARGVEREVPFTGGSWRPSDLDDAATPLAVGVLPFDLTTGPAPRLVVPRELRVAGPAHERVRALPSRDVGVPERLVAVPEQDKHVDAVARALIPLRDGVLRKVVLARVLDIAFATDVDPARVLHNLIADNPDGFTYAAALPGGRTLVGASPELLVRRYGTHVVAHPHAGTAPRSTDPDVDEANARGLLASAKDKTEHALVVEAVVEALRPFCRTLDVPSAPSLAPTPAVWHLGTEITGELTEPDEVSALELATALHPTPAVCGTPTNAARELVGELEPFDRDYYAGAVGWVDAAGDGEWAVAIRCAEIADRSMRLYAGGGIVAASDPDAELRETSAKFNTLLQAMGVDLDP
ncbi:isochorismate synthase [Haloechinothrix salitolerans]|uniref:isochorismate synthase n=1 Tax=Haloechinothrix salitolerans TaxID=926830 RepID=A0ABW2BWE8_9PSEU